MNAWPKAFPAPIRLGTDITSIERHSQLLEKLVDCLPKAPQTRLNRYFAKVFNRLEWPELQYRITRLVDADLEKATDSLPRWKRIAHDRKFVTWLAGRWAAKEAAIKAHHNRRLHMRQISILKHDCMARFYPGYESISDSKRPYMLIDPPAPRVVMSSGVAKSRGIPVQMRTCHPSQEDEGPEGPFLPFRVIRRARVEMDQRQLAELSISHDGGYATATVLATQEHLQSFDDREDIMDDGSSKKPLHEPDFGDEGFLDLGA